MIIFDAGHTLVNDYNLDILRGARAIYKYVKNKNDVTPEIISDTYEDFYGKFSGARKLNFEINNLQFQKFLFDYLGVEFTISQEEVEKIYWENFAECEPMPDVEKMLAFLDEHGVRTGVISNMDFSGKAFEERMNKTLPNNKFEFMMASSDYSVRKPSKYLFEIAIRKAKLEPDEVWFCGDNVRCDVIGSHEAGMYPVWYEEITLENVSDEGLDKELDFDHLHIRRWSELTDLLSKMN